MKYHVLKHESAMRICAEIARLDGVESLTPNQCFLISRELDNKATYGEAPIIEVFLAASKGIEHVHAYADDFDIIEVSDEDLVYDFDVDEPEYDEPYAGGAN